MGSGGLQEMLPTAGLSYTDSAPQVGIETLLIDCFVLSLPRGEVVCGKNTDHSGKTPTLFRCTTLFLTKQQMLTQPSFRSFATGSNFNVEYAIPKLSTDSDRHVVSIFV